MTRAGCLTSLAFLLFNLPMKASVKTAEWGRTSSNRPIKLFTLSDARIRVRLIEYGARIVSIDVPDRRGQTADVVLGHPGTHQTVQALRVITVSCFSASPANTPNFEANTTPADISSDHAICQHRDLREELCMVVNDYLCRPR
jgi:hypothetical protein